LNIELTKLLSSVEIIFWDFDGVIKESVKIKSNVFKDLFLPYGEHVAKKVCDHHENNGGMSRFKKIPLYLSWTNEPVTTKNIDFFCNDFSSKVVQQVIDSPWAPGVLKHLNSNNKKKHVLVTATPYNEIKFILKNLNIDFLFDKIYGAPTEKSDAIFNYLKNVNINPEKSIMIGDSESDYRAAIENNIKFVLKRTDLNKNLQNKLICKMFYNF
jgi:phosphoglycolate phosphatase-like HAD superfamily hydrolase